MLGTELAVHFTCQNFASAIIVSFFPVARSDLDCLRRAYLYLYYLPMICLGSLQGVEPLEYFDSLNLILLMLFFVVCGACEYSYLVRVFD